MKTPDIINLLKAVLFYLEQVSLWWHQLNW